MSLKPRLNRHVNADYRAHCAHVHDHPSGWDGYVYATNHKDIGTMYLVLAISAPSQGQRSSPLEFTTAVKLSS